jgi:SAM-dependent methyltransferase
MFHSIYDFKDFFNSPFGLTIRDIVIKKIHEYWPSMRGYRLIGLGYAQPYLEPYLAEAERCIAINPAPWGSFAWPEEHGNLSVLAEETELPIETNSVDRVLVVHSLEHAELPKSNLQEIFRILKSNGRLLIITPSRRSLWSRAEWSPFGHGTPYSGDQLRRVLRENLFVYERSCTTLFTPPIRWPFMTRLSPYCEKFLSLILPAFGGLHVIEASKQIYSGTTVNSSAKVVIRHRPATAEITTFHEHK